MPKLRADGKGSMKKGTPMSRKFRLGSRKAGAAGHTASTEDLLAIQKRGGKFGAVASRILQHRGIVPEAALEAA